MGKGFKGKTCIYCGSAESDTADHVIARGFFLPGEAENLPKVPACANCNNEKSRIEHYLTTVMPFGGQHAAASETLASLTPPRLEKNQKLHSVLADSIAMMFTSRDGGPWNSEMTVRIDGKELERLFGYIARGLAWHHWNVLFTAEHLVLAGFVAGLGPKLFEALLSLGVKRREAGNYGGGVFVYEGVQAKECSELTVWRMSLYGAQVSGDLRHPLVRCENAYAITTPRKWPASKMLLAILGMPDATQANELGTLTGFLI